MEFALDKEIKEVKHGTSKSEPEDLDHIKPNGETDSLPKPTVLELWKSLSFFDRFLAVFVFLAMVLGILIGNFANEQVQRHLNGGAKWGNVSIPLLIGLLIMIWPPLSKVEWECLPRLLKSRDLWVHLTVSFVLNWLVSPFIMLSLAWVTLPESALERERVGVVLVGVARCVAMVLVWNGIAQGDRDYCAILVVSNSILQMVLFAPYALLFANILCRSPTLTTPTLHLDYGNVAQSVGIYLGIPLVAGGLTRWIVCTCLLPSRRAKFYHIWGHVSGIGLLYVITVLFANQGKHIITHIGRIFRICVPLLLYFIIVWSITFFTFWRIRTTSWGRTYSSYEKAVTQAFTAGSNNFELAIAVAVASFGADAPEVLAATMGPLVEVPVLLLLSYLALYLRDRLNWSTKSKTGSDL